MNTSKVVVFDVGRVLVDFSFDPFEEFLTANGAEISTRQEFYSATKLFDFEKGKLHSRDFIKSIKSLLKNEIEEKELISRWVNIFKPIEEMILYALDLKTRARTLILSNTNSLHWEYLDEVVSIRSLTEKAFTSYEVGAMKPDPHIYNAVKEYAGVESHDIFFIDDLNDNIEGALNQGWNGIVHSGLTGTKIAVDRFLNSK